MQSSVYDPKQNMKRIKTVMHQSCVRPWELAVEPIRITPRVFYAGNSWVGVFLIDSGNGMILIDSGMPFMLYTIFESIRKIGRDPSEIKLALLSHAHYDHCGAMRAVLEYTRAVSYASREDAPYLQKSCRELCSFHYPYAGYQPDCLYSDTRPILMGDVVIETLLTPGHTPGTTSFFFEDKSADGRRLKLGLHGGLGLNTLTDDQFENVQDAVGMRSTFRTSLCSVKKREVDVALSLHPAVIGMLERAREHAGRMSCFEGRQIWPQMIDASIRQLDELESQQNRQPQSLWPNGRAPR